MSTNHRYLPIVIALMGEQKRLGIGDYKFARTIGISQPYWYRLRHGQRSAGDGFLRGADQEPAPEYEDDWQRDSRLAGITAGDGSHRKPGGVVGAPYLDGEQLIEYPEVRRG